MKKIGIMTMHRIVNYGSFLQAYGLKKIIEESGKNVVFVDYEFEKDIVVRSKRKSLIKRIISNYDILYYLKKKLHKKKFRLLYQEFINKYLSVKEEKNFYPTLDSLVIGSDEVFNCLQSYPVGYSRNLFGYGYENYNVISYAASFGPVSIESLKEYEIDKDISEMLKKFNAISVRDQNSFEIVKKLTGNEPVINLDPVLVSNYEEEMKLSKVLYDNYIILYAYTDRLTKQEEKIIKAFSKKINKKIISLGFYQKIADINLIVDPFLALSYIKKADFVITDTFHGTVFSIKLNTKFCTIVRKSNYNKLYYLLDKMSHLEQMVYDIFDIEKIYYKDISFDKSNQTIIDETKNTKIFLKNNL